MRDQNLTFHDFWICDPPGDPYLWMFMYQNTSRNIRKLWKHFEKYVYISGLPTFCQVWKRRAPDNPEKSSNEIFKIRDMGPIAIKKPAWIFTNMLPISNTKHKLTCWKFWLFYNFGITFLGSKTIVFSLGFIKHCILRCWNLDKCWGIWNSKNKWKSETLKT